MTHSATTDRRAAKTADGEGEAYWFYGDRAILRSPEGALPIIIEHHVGPGAAAPLHVHHDVDDSFYLLRGQLAMRCGDDTFVANAGDYVSLPKGVPHALSNVGAEEAVLLQTHDANSFLAFIRRAGIPCDQPQPDPASLDYAAMNNVAGQTGQPVRRCRRRKHGRSSPAAGDERHATRHEQFNPTAETPAVRRSR